MGYRKDYLEKGKEIDAILLANREKIENLEITRRELCTMCNCSITAINYHIDKLGIVAKQFEYTDEQEEFIKKNYPILNDEELAEAFYKEFGLEKHPQALRSRAKLLGVNRPHYKKWTREQEQWLRDNYPTGGTETQLTKEFNEIFNTNFSVDAIKIHAVRYLGLKRQEGYAFNRYKIGDVIVRRNTRDGELAYVVKINNIRHGGKQNYEYIPKDVYDNNALVPNSALAYGISKRLIRTVEGDIRENTPKKVKGKSNILTSRKIRAYMLEHQEEILTQQLSINDIAKELGVGYHAVQENRAKLNFPALLHSTEGLDEYLVSHKEEIFAKEITDEQIAKQFNLSIHTVVNHRQKLGIKFRHFKGAVLSSEAEDK